MVALPNVDFSIYISLGFLFGVAAQFRAMDGYSFLRNLLATVELRTGILYAVALVTFVFSPFILNDVLVIILTPVIIRYAKQHGVDPAPLVVAEITVTNVASSLTPLGNPQNILIWTASGLSFAGFVEGTWLFVLASSGIAALALLPFAIRLGTPRGEDAATKPRLPGVYLVLVVLATVAADFAGLRPYEALGIAFVIGFPFTRSSIRQVWREFDYHALAVLYLFVTAVTLFALVLGSSLQPLLAPIGRGDQPYSAALVGLASNLIGNVPLTQLVLSTVHLGAQAAPKLAVEAGFAGNLGPVASFANLLALQISSKGGVSVRRVIGLQLIIGLASYIPALF